MVLREVAESSRVLPVLVRDDRLFLAMANPHDKRVIDELEFVTGRHIYPYVAISTTLERTIKSAYDVKEQGGSQFVGPSVGVGKKGSRDRARDRGIDRETDRDLDRDANQGAPNAAGIFVDEKIEEVAAEADLSTTDFGQLGEEVSGV